MAEKEKILVIEDNPTDVTLVSFLLKSHNYDIIVAPNGEEGLDMAIEQKPKLIVLDVMMPKMDGFTFLQKLKQELNLEIPPVIMLTSRDQMEATFRMEGVTDYFVKPLETEKFIARVEQLLGDDK